MAEPTGYSSAASTTRRSSWHRASPWRPSCTTTGCSPTPTSWRPPPVHTYHLGLWFNSPNDAAAAGCPNTVTPFNGDHTAGIQVLNTSNFADDQGPLRQLVP